MFCFQKFACGSKYFRNSVFIVFWVCPKNQFDRPKKSRKFFRKIFESPSLRENPRSATVYSAYILLSVIIEQKPPALFLRSHTKKASKFARKFPGTSCITLQD